MYDLRYPSGLIIEIFGTDLKDIRSAEFASIFLSNQTITHKTKTFLYKFMICTVMHNFIRSLPFIHSILLDTQAGN